MPSGSDSYCIIAQGSSHRAGLLAPSWGILYVQSSNSVTQFQWNPSLMKQWEGYSLRPIFVETGLAFWGNVSYVSSMRNGLGLQCGISSKNTLRMQASQTSRRLVSLPLLEVPESWVKWQRFALGAFLFLFTRDPRLLSMLSSGDLSWPPGSSLSIIKLFSSHWLIKIYCPLLCFLRTLNEQPGALDKCLIIVEYMYSATGTNLK